MRTKKTPPVNVKKDSLPLSWVLVGIGFLIAIVLMIVIVVNRTNNVFAKQIHKTEKSQR